MAGLRYAGTLLTLAGVMLLLAAVSVGLGLLLPLGRLLYGGAGASARSRDGPAARTLTPAR